VTALTTDVERSFASCEDDRLRELLQTLVRHLHAFAIEVQLTESEWGRAIATLTETGLLSDDHRQEFVLWSDALGLSMLVDAIAHPKPTGASESTVLGPFWVEGSPELEYGEAIFTSASGDPAWVHGRVLDLDGTPISDAMLDVWQNDANGLYGVQDNDAPEAHLRGRFRTRADGTYAFLGVRPMPYPIPDDGPVGAMLAASGRHPCRPAHIHMIVSARGYDTLTTHIFDAESPYLDSDAVFAVKPSLLRRFVRDGERWSVQNDIVLAPAR